MYHARYIIDSLLAAKIDSYSGLHVSAGENWEMFLDKLGSVRNSQCLYLLVVVTEALYHSAACLDELFHAKERNVTVSDVAPLSPPVQSQS